LALKTTFATLATLLFNKAGRQSLLIKAKSALASKLLAFGLITQTKATVGATAAQNALNTAFYISPLG
jgi:hypothetical protein